MGAAGGVGHTFVCADGIVAEEWRTQPQMAAGTTSIATIGQLYYLDDAEQAAA